VVPFLFCSFQPFDPIKSHYHKEQEMKRTLWILSFAVLAFSCEEEVIVEELTCVQQKVEDFFDAPPNSENKIYTFTFDGETVVYIPARCCDIPSEVYDLDCNFVCSPDGGITGSGDGNCPNFFEEATNEELIWEDARACQYAATVDDQKYDSAPEDYGSILDARIETDCLFIEFGASGCSGDSWTWELIGSHDIAESYPVQRSIKLSFVNNESCAAYFEKEVGFDISELQLDEYDIIKLNLKNYGQLTYEY
jgi:hypothetical protein